MLYVDSDMFYLLVYMNDLLFTSSNSVMLKHFIHLLSLEFKLQELSFMHYFLVIKVKHTSMKLVLTQHKYALDIIH
jgi:hypothetical protein